MRASAPPVPTTLLDGQGPDAFDAIVVRLRPEDAPAVPLGIVFLHGFAGNFALQCLEVARSARAVGALTVCPSTTFDGRWAEPAGEATVRASIAYLRAEGAQRMVLAGISAGAIGASQLAPRLDATVDGMVLLSGVSSRAATPRVPTLLVQGDHDAMVRTARVRAWAHGHPRVRYRELPGTHFVLLEQRADVARELTVFLREVAARER
ncbi:MAG: hypothetical protein H6726_03595 [Sandaracinaceae bacterium]|nr:hypothetical protein [Myxococcales bacterium]MCB9656710.1 hypothetical protein [Sandaracinaceae bacterium]